MWEADCLTRGSDCSLLGTTRAQTIPRPQSLRCLLGRKVGQPGLSWGTYTRVDVLILNIQGRKEKGVPQRLKGQPELTCPFGLNYNLRVSYLKV